MSMPPQLTCVCGVHCTAGLADVYRVKSPVQLLRSQSFWLMFIVHGICAGSGLTLLNNLAEQV